VTVRLAKSAVAAPYRRLDDAHAFANVAAGDDVQDDVAGMGRAGLLPKKGSSAFFSWIGRKRHPTPFFVRPAQMPFDGFAD
jgi:hypothetical protein